MPVHKSHQRTPRKTRQKLGQHFLSDISWRKRIAETLPVAPDSVWVEIGAGHGEMTELLAKRARRVIAIETDATLVASLRNRAAKWPNAHGVEIVHADILSLDLAALIEGQTVAELRQGTALVHPEARRAVPNSDVIRGASAPGVSLQPAEAVEKTNSSQHFRVYGNLPYYITSPILTHLFRFAAQIDSIHIVTQLEVAERIAAHPGSRDYGYLSTLCQYYSRPELLFRIPGGAFHPPPKVTSALLEMRLPGERASLGIHNDAAFLKFLRACFAQKRKTLRNNLRDTYTHNAIAKALAASALTDNSRAEELTLRQFAQIFTALNEGENSTSAQKTV